MASLKNNNLPSSEALLGRQKGKPVIYVEGESDRKIFENYWFNELLEKVSFNTVAATQGCTAVVNTVANDRRQGVEAFGIVDRDKLMADGNWSLLRETDDEVFEQGRPYPEIKVTLRWELESYLIEPDALEAYLAPAQGGRLARSTSDVETELLEHADALIPFAALNQALHRHSIKAPGDGYTGLDDRLAVQNRIDLNELAPPPDIWNDYQKNIPLMDAFAGVQNATSRQKLQGLLRTVNGKAMLERVKKSARIQHDITYLIAKEIRQAGRVPAEIEQFIQNCCNLVLC